MSQVCPTNKYSSPPGPTNDFNLVGPHASNNENATLLAPDSDDTGDASDTPTIK
jgi:hypothetical protein